MSFELALGGMRAIPQWFIWRLVWNDENKKYDKTPCGPDGSVFKINASLPNHWMTYDAARNTLTRLSSLGKYALGFWMTAECGYWFFDIDKVHTQPAGVVDQFIGCFPGAFVEVSSSANGIHIIGRTVGPVQPHCTKDSRWPDMEFYTAGRGIAFGLDLVATGCMDTAHDAMVASLLSAYFPPKVKGEAGVWDAPRDDWRGPADNDELIRRALAARGSAASAFGGKASFGQLWRGEAIKCSENDLAIASHLAFWTGCDAPRMEILMRQSGMYREKWDSHKTYLSELTIPTACSGCKEVYKEPVKSNAMQIEMYQGVTTHVQGEIISQEIYDKVEELLTHVYAASNVREIHNNAIPLIQAVRLPPAIGEQLVQAVNKQLAHYGAKLPLSKLRALLCPPNVLGANGESPLWVQRHCYVKDKDYFFDLENGSMMSMQGFIAEYGRLMPTKDNGGRENAAEWALHRWGMRTVHHTAYRPDEPSYFNWNYLEYANKYNATTIPDTATEYTPEGVRGIEAFKSLLWDMCARREELYLMILSWMAHNVQKPGKKIRWSPIFKGVQGDGKSIIGEFLRSAMGWRNVSVTGNATLRSSGGFNDWAVGGAVNVIEEIMLTGKERHAIYNAMKEFITNDTVNINPKGQVTFLHKNVTNHIATSNHSDAIPLEPNDRRWLVIFTPWESLAGMEKYSGLGHEGFQERFDVIDHCMKHLQSEARAWLLSLSMHDKFNSNRLTITTPEKAQMMASSRDDIETVAQQLIAEGHYGITENVVSSSCLTNLLKMKALSEGFDAPRGMAVNHLLTRLGYSQVGHVIKWENKAHRIWIKNGVNNDNEQIRKLLNFSIN